MKRLSTLISFFFTKSFYHKAAAYILLIGFLFLFQGFALIFFLTFIFSFLFYSSAKFIKEKVDLFACAKLDKVKTKIFFKKYFSLNIVIAILYIIFVIIMYYLISNILPDFKEEIKLITNGEDNSIISSFGIIQNNLIVFINQIDPNNTLNLNAYLDKTFEEIDLKNIGNSILNSIGALGKMIVNIFIALLLSFVFLLDRKKIKKYLGGIKESNFSFLYNEYQIIFDKIIRSFGLILKAQSLIAAVNTSLTIFGLFIIGTAFLPGVGFPYLLTLGFVVFIFGFVPVVGVFLSSIPIMLVGYSIPDGGVTLVITILVLILIIHAIEAYYLNPRIVSGFLELPVSLTFVILFVGEGLFGIAGLLIGVSLFYFITELLRDIDKAISKKHKVKKIEKKIIKRLKKAEG